MGASAKPNQAAAKQGNVKAVAFFGFAAANSFAQATWAGVKQERPGRASKAKFFDPNFNAQTQVSQIQDAITSGEYQAFVVQANDGNAVIPADPAGDQGGHRGRRRVHADRQRLRIDRAADPGHDVRRRVAGHERHRARRLGVTACKGVNPCNVAYLEGFKSLPLDNARTAAVKKQLATASNVKLVARSRAATRRPRDSKAAQDVLQAHSDVNVIIGSSQAIEGAEQAVKKAGKTGQIKLIGNGGSCQAVAGVKSGRVVRDVRAAGDDVRPQGDAARDQGRQRAEGADELQRRHAHEPAADEGGTGEDALQGAVLRLSDAGARMTTGLG